MAEKKKSRQAEVSAGVDAGPVAARREMAWWVQGLIVFGVTYCLGLGLRLWELPFWLAGDFRLDVQWLQATNDAYLWLAGAEGIFSTARSGRTAVPDYVAWLAGLTGWSHANIAFWLPAVMAPLAALPVCLVAARWRMPEAGLWAGVLAVVAPGYWQRTRLGFLDDDFLFIPAVLLLIGGLVLALGPFCRDRWFARGDQTALPAPWWQAVALLAGALLLGWLAKLGVWIYPKGFALVFAVVLCGLAAGVFLARSRDRVAVLCAFALLFGAWFAELNMALILAGAGTTLALVSRWTWLHDRGSGLANPAIWLPALVLALAGAAAVGQGFWLPRLEWTWNQILAYHEAVTSPDARRAVFLGTVSEAIRLPPWGVAHLLAGHWTALLLGAVGFALLLWKRPLAVVFLPLVGIAGAAFFLGARFTVFSASVFGLGLGCGMALLLGRLHVSPVRRWIVMIVLLPLVFWPLVHPLRHTNPQPVVSTHQAQALVRVGEVAHQNARIWNHWDLGFATGYYTQRQAIEMSGTNRGIFARALAKRGRKTARDEIFRRGGKREHYVVVAMETLGKLQNMLAQGTFDPATGESARQGESLVLSGRFEIDQENGFFIAPDRKLPLRSLHVLIPISPQGFSIGAGQYIQAAQETQPGQTTLRRSEWPEHEDGRHAIYNPVDGSGFLLDANVRATMFAQLLLDDPESFLPEFELVVDDSPWVRVFVVK